MSTKEEELSKKLSYYQELAKVDKNVDLSALMINEMQNLQDDKRFLSHSAKRWGYTVSLIAPPLGFIFALKFWFSDKEDGRHAALICVGLTAFSLAATTWFFNSIMSGVETNLDTTVKSLEGLY
jgi:hypothetical protein